MIIIHVASIQVSCNLKEMRTKYTSKTSINMDKKQKKEYKSQPEILFREGRGLAIIIFGRILNLY